MRASLAPLIKIVLMAVVSGCTTSGPPPASPLPTAAPVSLDGNYRGTIRLTASAVSGAQANWCDTPPVISLLLQNNAFSYILAHPNLPKDSNYSLSPSFAGAVASDGSSDVTSQNGEAEMVGRITGSRMVGQINGTGCSYAFTAERS
jgi:hypothetical protein